MGDPALRVVVGDRYSSWASMQREISWITRQPSREPGSASSVAIGMSRNERET